MKKIALFTVCIIFIMCNAAKAQIPVAPEICMVTVDNLSINNVVYWNKALYPNVGSFIVYREVDTTLHVYQQVGAVSNDSLSLFIDTARSIGPNTGDPNTGSSRYKLQIRNTVGNYSTLGLYHSTLYIDDGGLGDFEIKAHYSIEGLSNPVNAYMLLCDTISNDVWIPVATISNTASVATDPAFSQNFISAQWRMKTDWGITCEAMRAPIITTRSNIKRPGISLGVKPNTRLDASIMLYPNPTTDNITLEFSPLKENIQLNIINVLGQSVYNEMIISSSGKTIKQINANSFGKGIFTVVLETNTAKTFKKLVIN